MKTVINNEGSDRLEFFKRILYSFQVLIVGIALPFLFLIGTSTRCQKKPTETEMGANHRAHESTTKNSSSISCKQDISG
jgi:hypothetical protein